MPRTELRIAMVAAAAVACFVPALFGDFVSDERTLFRGPPRSLSSALFGLFWDVQGSNEAGGLYARAYRPVVQVVFALQQRAFGAVTAGYHAVSLLLHALVALLALRWLRRRLDTGAALAGEWAALAGALLFAVHPSHAESVAGIAGSTDLWMAAGLLLGLELIEHERRGAIALGGLCLAAAVLAKEVAVLAPVLWALDRFARGRAAPGDGVRFGVAVAAVGSAAALVYAVAWTRAAGAPDGLTTPSGKVAAALLASYVGNALWPAQLCFQAQPFAATAGGIAIAPARVASGVGLVAALVVAGAWSLRRPRLRPWIADAAWLVLPLLPVVTLVQLVLSDRYLYLPLLGLAALAARGLERALATQALPRGAIGAGAVLIIGLGAATSTRAARHFVTEEALWRSQVAAFPDLPQPIDALGEELARQGRHAEARGYFERGYRQAMTVRQQRSAVHFALHLITFDPLVLPEWRRAEMHAASERCVALFERRHASYERGALRIALSLRAADVRELERDVGGVLLPCARALLSDQRLADAVAWSDRARALRPNDPGVLEVAVLARSRAGDFAGAHGALAVLRRVAPGPALSALEQRLAAARELAARPRPPGARERALFDAQRLLALGTPEGARRALAEHAARAPTDQGLAHALVQTYVYEARFEEGARVLERGARLSPADPFWPGALSALERARAELAERARPR